MSLHRNWRLRIQDIIDCAETIEQYTAGLDFRGLQSTA
jgi:uncharacterized protein with HEPN domain